MFLPLFTYFRLFERCPRKFLRRLRSLSLISSSIALFLLSSNKHSGRISSATRIPTTKSAYNSPNRFCIPIFSIRTKTPIRVKKNFLAATPNEAYYKDFCVACGYHCLLDWPVGDICSSS